MSVLYCQSPALFWCALALIVCFFVRRGAHRVRAVLDLVLGLLCIVGGVALYYLGMYNDAFTIRDFWQIRTAGWIGLAVVVLLTAWQVIKATRRSVSARRSVWPKTPPPPQTAGKTPDRWVAGSHSIPLRQGTWALPYRCSFDKRSVGRGPRAPPFTGSSLAMSFRGGPQGRRGNPYPRTCRTHKERIAASLRSSQ